MTFQRTAFTIAQYKDAGCAHFSLSHTADKRAEALHQLAAGKICDGCGIFSSPTRCPAYLHLVTSAAKAPQRSNETVRQSAARLGVSISEIRRRRAAGVLL